LNLYIIGKPGTIPGHVLSEYGPEELPYDFFGLYV
jgi:hypothetical protein